MDLKTGPLTGAITSVTFSRNSEVLFVGSGSYINVFNVSTGNILKRQRIFDSCCIHGLQLKEDVAAVAYPNVAVIWGHKSISVFGIIMPSNNNQEALLCELAQLTGIRDLIWEACFLEYEQMPNALAIGLAHNSVEVWDWITQVLLCRVDSEVRCMLRTIAFKGESYQTLQVATGAHFGQVIVWNPHNGPEAEQSLIGHEGVVLKVVWATTTRSLASVSEDRTVRVWTPNAGGQFEVVFTGWGHTARLWDVAFFNNDQRLVTVSEDATALRWELGGVDGGRQVGPPLVGHAGKHIWCVAVADSVGSAPSIRSVAVTGGNDGSAKLWDLGSCQKFSYAVPAPKFAKHPMDDKANKESKEIYLQEKDVHGSEPKVGPQCESREVPDGSGKLSIDQKSMRSEQHHKSGHKRKRDGIRALAAKSEGKDTENIESKDAGSQDVGSKTQQDALLSDRENKNGATVAEAKFNDLGKSSGTPASIHVKNLNESVSEEDLKSVFAQFGQINSVHLHANRGFAFIVFENSDSAKRAIEQTGRIRLKENQLEIEVPHLPDGPRAREKKAKKPKACRVTVSSLAIAYQNEVCWIYVAQGKKEVQRTQFKTGKWQEVLVPVEQSSVSTMAVHYSVQKKTMLLFYGGHASDISIVYGHEKKDPKVFWFKGHGARIMKIHIQVQFHTEKGEEISWLFTSSVDGALKCWKFEDIASPDSCHLIQHHSLQRKGVAMSVTVDFKESLVFVGTNKGHIHVFPLLMERGHPESHEEAMCLPQVPHQSQFLSAHGHQQVSCLILHEGYIYSGGNDGYIHAYSYYCDDEGRLKFRRVQTFPATPISTVSKIWMQPSPRLTGFSLFAAGFQSSQFFVLDLFSRRQWMQAEAGAWKRPHFVSPRSTPPTSLCMEPDFLFGFTSSPPKENINVLTVHHNRRARLQEAYTELCPNFGEPFHGRSVWAVVFCGVSCNWSQLKVLTAGEDCSIKLSQVMSTGSGHYALKVLQHCTPHKTSIRALAASTPSKRGNQLLVSGGGKLSLTVWRLLCNSEESNSLQVHHMEEVTIDPDADQDHRILSAAVLPLSLEDKSSHLIATGDSEGRCTLFLAGDGPESHCDLLCSFFHDGKPVLCCSIQAVAFPNKQRHAYLICGSTTGSVAAFYLGNLMEYLHQRDTAQPFTKSELEDVNIPTVLSYSAHQMGVNCMSTSPWKIGAEDPEFNHFVICTGGDDQALSISVQKVSWRSPDNVELVALHSHQGASGSGLKGIKILNENIYTIGYDQRLNIWRLAIDTVACAMTRTTESIFSWSPSISLTWCKGSVVDVTDVSALDVIENRSSKETLAVVAGQGVQLISTCFQNLN